MKRFFSQTLTLASVFLLLASCAFQQSSTSINSNVISSSVISSMTSEATLNEIVVSRLPYKLEFTNLEGINTAGGQIDLRFSNNQIVTIDMRDDMVDYSLLNLNTIGTQSVKLNYTFNGVTRSTSYQVTIRDFKVAVDNIFFTNRQFVLNLLVGSSRQLLVAFLPENATNQGVSYQSSNPEIVSIDQFGMMQALAVGEAVVSATSNETNQTISKTVIVEELADPLSVTYARELISRLAGVLDRLSLNDYTSENFALILGYYNQGVTEIYQSFTETDANLAYALALERMGQVNPIPVTRETREEIVLINYAKITFDSMTLDITVLTGGLLSPDHPTLGGKTIFRNVTVSETVADGSLTIQDIIIFGELLILGGGKNSIYLIRVDILRVIIRKADDGSEVVRVEFADGSFEEIIVQGNATITAETTIPKIEVDNPSSTVTIQGSASITELVTNANIIVDAPIKNVVVNAPIVLTGTVAVSNLVANANVDVQVSVDRIEVPSTASSNVVLTINEPVSNLVINKANTNVSGTQSAGYIEVKADAVINVPNSVINVTGGSAIVGGQSVSSGLAQTNQNSTKTGYTETLVTIKIIATANLKAKFIGLDPLNYAYDSNGMSAFSRIQTNYNSLLLSISNLTAGTMTDVIKEYVDTLDVYNSSKLVKKSYIYDINSFTFNNQSLDKNGTVTVKIGDIINVTNNLSLKVFNGTGYTDVISTYTYSAISTTTVGVSIYTFDIGLPSEVINPLGIKLVVRVNVLPADQVIVSDVSQLLNAINSAQNNDLILVGPGVYELTDNLVINKSIHLKSTSPFGAILMRAGIPSGREETITISANDVKIEGFVIRNAYYNNSNLTKITDGRAIAPTNSNNLIIINNRFENSYRAIQGDYYGSPTSLTIENNIFDVTVDRAIIGTENMKNLKVLNNQITATETGIGLGVGVTIDLIQNNTFRNTRALTLYEPGLDLTKISSNIFINSRYDGYIVVDARTSKTNENITIETLKSTNSFDKNVMYGNLSGSSVDVIINPEKYGNLVFNQTNKLIYSTIQLAIQNANPNDTILVGSGNYNELVVIDKEIKLHGPNWNIDGKSTNRLPEAKINAVKDETDQLIIDANNVEILGFYFERNYTLVPINQNVDAIYIFGDKGNNSIIKNNIINGYYQGYGSIFASGYVYENNAWKFSTETKGLVIENNLLSNGGYIYLQGTSATVKGNKITGARAGMQIQPYDNPNPGLVEGNEIESYRTGLWFNYAKLGAGTWTFENNIIKATDNNPGGSVGVWDGIRVQTYATEGAGSDPMLVVKNNVIDGIGLERTNGLRTEANTSLSGKYEITGNEFKNVKIGVDLYITETFSGSLVDILKNNTFPEFSRVVGNQIKKT